MEQMLPAHQVMGRCVSVRAAQSGGVHIDVKRIDQWRPLCSSFVRGILALQLHRVRA